MSSTKISVADRLDKLREIHDTTITSSDRSATPLWIFLKFLAIRDKSCLSPNVDFEFAQILYEYLSPIELPVLTPIQERTEFPIFMGWGQIHGLAVMIANCSRIDSVKIDYTKRAILHTLYTKVLPEMYS